MLPLYILRLDPEYKPVGSPGCVPTLAPHRVKAWGAVWEFCGKDWSDTCGIFCGIYGNSRYRLCRGNPEWEVMALVVEAHALEMAAEAAWGGRPEAARNWRAWGREWAQRVRSRAAER